MTEPASRRVLRSLWAPVPSPPDQPMPVWRRRGRLALSLFYGLAGVLHVGWPGPFLSITPDWVPYPQAVIFVTGLCEISGAFGLWSGWLYRAAAVGLALYAVCVYPANVKHALDALGAGGTGLKLLYHIPRLAFQPVLVWLPLFSAGLITWPFSNRRRTTNPPVS